MKKYIIEIITGAILISLLIIGFLIKNKKETPFYENYQKARQLERNILTDFKEASVKHNILIKSHKNKVIFEITRNWKTKNEQSGRIDVEIITHKKTTVITNDFFILNIENKDLSGFNHSKEQEKWSSWNPFSFRSDFNIFPEEK
jgi:hypothetical protein